MHRLPYLVGMAAVVTGKVQDRRAAWRPHGAFNPKEDRWIEYVLPRTWIDNSTTPVTVWYVDHNGYMVRVQPRE
jgi:hypothetical protein